MVTSALVSIAGPLRWVGAASGPDTLQDGGERFLRRAGCPPPHEGCEDGGPDRRPRRLPPVSAVIDPT